MPTWEKHTVEVRFYSDDDKKYVTESFNDLSREMTDAEVRELASIAALVAPATHLLQSVAKIRRDRFSYY